MNTDTGAGLSIVIATLGGSFLAKTIGSLINGSQVPNEILICIPSTHKGNVAHLSSDIVKIIEVEAKGQVKQRAIGFTKAAGPLVLQLDDDILLEKNTLQELTTRLRILGPGNNIGPVYYGIHTGRCIHEIKTGPGGFMKNLFDTVICAAPWGKKKMGKVTGIGINYGVDDAQAGHQLLQTEWLSGGCVLSFKDDLITEDFFPFEGKAYCEDVIHSYFRRQAKNTLWVEPRLRVYIDEPEPEFSKAAVNKVIQIRRFYLSLVKGPQWRLSLYELFCRIRSAVFG